MKLLDYLRKVLPAYPDNGCVAVTQDHGGNIYFWKTAPVYHSRLFEWISAKGQGHTCDDLVNGGDYYLADSDGEARENPICDDYNTAIITREQFETYNMKDDTPTITATGSLIEWRDRIIEIENLQTKLQNEKRDLYSKISETGFKLDLTGMKK